MAGNIKMAAPCGLYCGSCRDHLVNKYCHGCGCECGECAAVHHHKECAIFQCCVKQKGREACSQCGEFPCSKLIRFCYDPVWLTHLPVIENLRRQEAIGTEKWLAEQDDYWRDETRLQRYLWFQKECEDRWKRASTAN
jgi:hypothetical protein